jgi:gas vesicle protein GvpL/GvpF
VSYLLYCILNGRRGAARPVLSGVRDQAVWTLECGDLCAAVSADAPFSDGGREPASSPKLEDLFAYAKVVEAFNRRETVVPMRYGCHFQGVAEVRAWVRSSAAYLCALLRRVDGCVEMGVRALLLEKGTPASLARTAAAGAIRPGAAYLAARRVELAPAHHGDRVAQLVREAMAGRFRECFAEGGCSGRRPIVSLYFLVERSRLGAFSEAFGRIAPTDAALMLSGPWPPYNFVCGGAGGDELAPMRALR